MSDTLIYQSSNLSIYLLLPLPTSIHEPVFKIRLHKSYLVPVQISIIAPPPLPQCAVGVAMPEEWRDYLYILLDMVIDRWIDR